MAPGVPDALAALAAEPETYRLALVTGNLEPVAHRKLAAAGIGHFFARGQGGFGSDAEERGELPAIARARAGGWARERTVVIGDTPRDIACARVDRVRVIAVATGPFAAGGPGGRGRRRGRRPRRAAGPGRLGRGGLTGVDDPRPAAAAADGLGRRLQLAGASQSMPVAAPISPLAGGTSEGVTNTCPKSVVSA